MLPTCFLGGTIEVTTVSYISDPSLNLLLKSQDQGPKLVRALPLPLSAAVSELARISSQEEGKNEQCNSPRSNRGVPVGIDGYSVGFMIGLASTAPAVMA